MKAILTICIPDNELAKMLEKEHMTLQQFTEEIKEGLEELNAEDICPGATASIAIE